MQAMTSQTEGRLMKALDRVGAEAGDDPDAPALDGAIAKAARECGLGPGHLPLLVHAYNVGRTARQRHAGSTPEEKAASFVLADVERVRNRLYPGTSTAKAAAEDAVASVYSARPARPERPTPAPYTPVRVKAAAEAPAEDPMAVLRAAESGGTVRRAAATVRAKAAAEDRALRRALEKAADLLRERGAPALGEVRENVRITRGESAASLLDWATGSDPRLAKRASERDDHPYDPQAPVYRAIDEAIDAARHLTLLTKAAERLEAEADAIRAAVRAGWREKAAAGLASTSARALQTGASASLGARLVGGFADSLRDKEEQNRARMLREVITPEHDQKLRQIRTTALLSDLMHSDPILSGHGNPGDVLDAFNQISSFAPRIVDQPLVMGPLLRRAVQSPLELYDVQTLSGIAKAHDQAGQRYAPPAAGAKEPSGRGPTANLAVGLADSVDRGARGVLGGLFAPSKEDKDEAKDKD